jgi:hypothetical protein
VTPAASDLQKQNFAKLRILADPGRRRPVRAKKSILDELIIGAGVNKLTAFFRLFSPFFDERRRADRRGGLVMGTMSTKPVFSYLQGVFAWWGVLFGYDP